MNEPDERLASAEKPGAGFQPPPADRATPVKRSKKRAALFTLAWVVLVPALLFSIWAAVTLNYVYSSGERAGVVQKFSKKGWLCKTWEGELAMVNPPGVLQQQIFPFTVPDDSIAGAINASLGKRVSLRYEQHLGVPTTCFGETEYFVTGVRVVIP